MGINQRDVVAGLRVRHRTQGWTGTITRVSPTNLQAFGIVEISQDPGANPAQWLHLCEFDRADGTLIDRPAADWPWPKRPYRPTSQPIIFSRPDDVLVRYYKDPDFYNLVNTLLAIVAGGRTTPQDLIDGAILAQTIDQDRREREPVRERDDSATEKRGPHGPAEPEPRGPGPIKV